MRLVLKINRATAGNSETQRKLTNAVVRLLGDGHRLVIIAPEGPVHPEKGAQETAPLHFNGNKYKNGASMVDRNVVCQESRFLAARLSHAGVPSMALSGTDAGICRLRKRCHNSVKTAFAIEISSVDPRWIELICSNGGVPVLSNWVMDNSSEFHLADPDQMASACAIYWNADALIYLTDHQGITNASGTVIRWLDVAAHGHHGSGNGAIADSVVEGCKHALQRGVRRTRILPAASLDSLPLFYFARIEEGTEVVLSAGEKPLAESCHSAKSNSI